MAMQVNPNALDRHALDAHTLTQINLIRDFADLDRLDEFAFYTANLDIEVTHLALYQREIGLILPAQKTVAQTKFTQ